MLVTIETHWTKLWPQYFIISVLSVSFSYCYCNSSEWMSPIECFDLNRGMSVLHSDLLCCKVLTSYEKGTNKKYGKLQRALKDNGEMNNYCHGLKYKSQKLLLQWKYRNVIKQSNETSSFARNKLFLEHYSVYVWTANAYNMCHENIIKINDF